MRLISFGTVDLPEHDGNDRLPISFRNNLINLQNGGVDLDGNTNYLNIAALTRRAVIVSNLSTTFRNVTREAAKGRLLLRGRERDNTEYQTFAKVVQINPDIDARMYNCEQALDISWLQDYPFWLASADEPTYLDDGAILDDYVWNLDGGNSDTLTITSPNTSGSTTIDNTGIAKAFKLYIVISATGTNIEIGDITITNVTNGLQFSYTGGLGDGSSSSEGDIVIDCLSKTVFLDTSEHDYTTLDIPNNQSDIMNLEVGENVINVQFDSISGTNNLTVEFFWSRHYLY